MENIELLLEALKKEGLRFTEQRKSIWDEITSSDDHREAEDIFLSLRKKNINVSRATVYRTIDVLVKNNLVRKLDIGDAPSKYENKIDSHHHDHMICLETGDIIEFYNEQLENLQDEIAKKHGYIVVRHVHQLFVKPMK
tara:strand:- start:5625 stop:6041 length:417 start_codon:yes stop_codon:yes gene_type:complete